MGKVWCRRELVTVMKYLEPTLIHQNQNQIIRLINRDSSSSIDFPQLKVKATSCRASSSSSSGGGDNNYYLTGGKNYRRGRRGLIRVSTAEGKWKGNWKAEYVVSLRDLNLQDLAENGDSNSKLSVSLSISRHTGFGLSVDGRITTSFIRRCSNCSSPYCREKVAQRNYPKSAVTIHPYVIYVKQGCEADLDSLIQDTMRLTTSVNETCSESCAKSELRVQHPSKKNPSTIDKRWSKLLELRDSIK